MAYCTAADVRTIVNTALSDSEITGIIEMSDADNEIRAPEYSEFCQVLTRQAEENIGSPTKVTSLMYSTHNLGSQQRAREEVCDSFEENLLICIF